MDLSPDELAKRDEIVRGMLKNKRTLVKRYIKDKKERGEEPANIESIIYTRANKLARKLRETQMETTNLRELVRTALTQERKRPDYADVDGDGNRTEPMAKAFQDKAKKVGENYKPNYFNNHSNADDEEFPIPYHDDGTPINVGEDLDLGHTDNEPHMLKADLYRIGKYAMELYQMVDQFEGKGEVDFPHWWQAKIINAREALVSAKHYLDFETKEPEVDAMVGAIDKSGALNNVGVGENQVDMFATKASKTDNAKETYFKFLKDFAKSAGVSGEELGKMSYNDLENRFGGKLARKYGLKKSNVADRARELVSKGVIQVDEKKLTKPELKKREEIAKAIEKDNPKMKMGKKMEISTSIAKRVAERLKK
jgi:hypothetical protein